MIKSTRSLRKISKTSFLWVYIRDGNGEQGDFVDKNRHVKVTPEEWTHGAAEKDCGNHFFPAPVLFIASDNPQYIGLFQTQLEGEGISVVHWKQEYPTAGTGVFMGQYQQKGYDQDQRLQKWRDMLFDMILLGSTDVLIPGQYSSFSQTMPMHLALGKPSKERRFKTTFCQVVNEGSDMDCYKSLMDWRMNTREYNGVKTWLPARRDMTESGWTSFLAQMPKHSSYRIFSHASIE
jgi:hypothetical protein